MMKRYEFVQTALSYLETPFHHQGRLPHVGLDCAGLVVCAARANGYQIEDVQGYAHMPSQGIFNRTLLKHCDIIKQDEVLPGDLMGFAFEAEEQHVAIVTSINPVTLLHSYSQVRKVVENHMDATWQSRLRGCYRIKGIE